MRILKIEYAMFTGYAAYLSSLNPENKVQVVFEHPDDSPVFSGKTVGADGYVLKGVCTGILLSAVDRHGNNQM
ncbi:hypothetical protein SLEP1_g50199 [Rubroshorea leprosula]|uniref:Uncharacterized protein n=1 Tax=Rubroshorea leprosula TaxID=152421 RepID=A0AAV5M1A0_9ROSI|nr:hypothetical protein SLEP1_g50199 [Rubroshorea leprosula]